MCLMLPRINRFFNQNNNISELSRFVLTFVYLFVTLSDNNSGGGVRVTALQTAVYSWQWRVSVYFTEPRPVEL